MEGIVKTKGFYCILLDVMFRRDGGLGFFISCMTGRERERERERERGEEEENNKKEKKKVF
jgi:hypothetical protein